MNRIAMLFGGGLLAAGLSLTAFGHEGEDHGEQITIQGELIDTACFVSSEGDAKGPDHAECAQKCMATGIPAAILPEGKEAKDMMFLLTNPVVLAPYAAQTIKVEGSAHPDMHAIDVKKLYVKDGENWKEIQLQDEHHKMTDGSEEHAEHEGHGEGHQDGEKHEGHH
jgi:hypothetical protein